MSHINVPYTVKRAGFFYFNLRSSGKIIRVSLYTKDSTTALRRVSHILDLMKKSGETQIMEDLKIRKLVRSVIESEIQQIDVLFNNNEDLEDVLYRQYRKSYLERQFSGGLYDKDLDTYSIFKIKKICSSQDAGYRAGTALKKLFLSEDSNSSENILELDASDFTKEFFKSEEELERFYLRVNHLKDHLLNGDIDSAEQIYLNLKKMIEGRRTFNELFEQFMRAGLEGTLHKSMSGGEPWDETRYKDVKNSFNLFGYYFEGTSMQDVTSNELDTLFREYLSNFPRRNLRIAKQNTIPELFEIVAQGIISEDDMVRGKTVANHYKNLATFYNYYEKVLGGNSQAFRFMNFKPANSEKRAVFSVGQVFKMLTCVSSLGPGKKWPIYIMAHTGMRNAEIMQLRKEDILELNGVHSIRVTEEAGELKTISSNRIIPIHKWLIEQGFIEFVEDCKEEYLFKRYSTSDRYLTRLYANFIKKECDFPDTDGIGRPLSLYSLRHFVVTTLRTKNVPDMYVKAIVGHSLSGQQDITDNYSHPDDIKLMQEYINSISICAESGESTK